MDEAAILTELAKLGAVGALFGLNMWLVFRLADKGLGYMVDIERLRMEVSLRQADALLEHAKSDDRDLAVSRELEEQRIVLQRIAQSLEQIKA